ncbi:uncharacterized protein LOC141726799 [Zonotrichia albicollis]|uniref:uncharacterized protein LOC141726799 n=1 Tax=Zonotrichia albicollis TaxID=44394 RepID=UPI003D8115E8
MFPLNAAGAGKLVPESASSVGGATSPVSGPAQPAEHAQSVKAAGTRSSVGAPPGPTPVGGQPAPLRSVGAVPTVEPCSLGRALIGGLPGSLVPLHSDAALQAAPLSASCSSAVSGARGPALVLSRPVLDSQAVPAPAPAEAAPAGAAEQQGAGVFTFSTTADTAGGRPVGAPGHGAFSSNHWTLPACQVTVRPRHPERFWREAKTKTDEMNEPVSSRHLQGGGVGSFGSAGAAGGAEAAYKAHQPRVKVRVRNLVTKQWEGPYDLIASGRGYACVSTDTGALWVPSKCVRPDLRPQRQNSADEQDGNRDQPERHQAGESLSDDSDADDESDHSDDSTPSAH